MMIGRCAPLAAVAVSVSLAWAIPAAATDTAAHTLAQKFAAGAEQEDAKRKEAEKRKAAEAKRKADEAKRKAAAEAKRKADAEKVRLAIEEAEMLERAQREADERKAALDRARAEEEAREARRIAEEREAAERAEKARRLAEEQRIARERFIAEQQRLEEEKRLAEEKRAEEERLAAEKRAAEDRRATEEKRIAEEKHLADERRLAEQRRAEEERLTAEKRAEEERRLAEEKRTAEQKRVEEEARRLAEDRRRLAEERQRLADEQRALEEQRKALLAAERKAEHERLTEKLMKREEERKANQRIGENNPMGLGAKPPLATAPSVAAAAPATTRVTVLLVMEPGTNGIRRYGRKVADPVLCAGATCWVGTGTDRTAAARARGQVLGPGNTLGHRAAACNQRLACAFRNVDLKTRPATVQPIDLRIMRHDRREFLALEADPSCRLSGGALVCDKTYTARTWRAWVVPEMLAAEAGPAALEAALTSGLARPSAALIPDGL